ncbi:MAG: hypothetical protein FWG87_06465 [Defluviitaleaceae bacterium]|nr:hypothetical protein [Defluviitaleaceae bacterium]
MIDEINERVEWIRENELAFEKNISDTIIMLEAWFDGSDIVYFNRGYHGLGVLELDFYYDSYGKLVFIFLNGIELGSNNEEIYKQFNLYFYEDSLIKLEDVSSVHVEMGTSEIHDWLIDNVDGLLDSAYNEWKELIK